MSETNIHPLAAVDPGAEIGTGTTVGPFAIVEGGAVVGKGCDIKGHAVICGHTTVGEGNFVGHGAILGTDPQDLSFDPGCDARLVIGDRNRIREYATLHRASKPGAATVLGDDNFLMAGAHVGHDCKVGNHVIMANNCLLAGHVTVQDRAFLGGGSVYHQFIRVGYGAITQGKSGFGKDLPPFVIGAAVNRVAGLNSVGLRRLGVPAGERSELKELYRMFFRSGAPVSIALAEASAREWREAGARFLAFIREAGRRGICSGVRKGEGGDDMG